MGEALFMTSREVSMRFALYLIFVISVTLGGDLAFMMAAAIPVRGMGLVIAESPDREKDSS